MKLFENLKIGTFECGLVCGIIGIVLALLLIFLGFWKTLFICVLGGLGAFIGGVKDKPQFCKNVINKVLPKSEN